MNPKTISVDNLGPIEHFEFSGSKPGVTVFSGPNGIGKSIFQKAIETAAKGSGPVPLRDNTRSGKVEAFGATITIGGNCRHTGTFEVLSLNGKINLAELVDPRKETPAVCDARRIKALVSMTGIAADINRFRTHEAFAETFDAVVGQETAEVDDLVEMAKRIQKNYYEAAVTQERKAERETGMASALVPPAELDLTEECDAELLQKAYNEARDEVTKLEEQARNAKVGSERVSKANELLKSFGADELQKERETLRQVVANSDQVVAENNATITELLQDIENLRNDNKIHQSKSVDSAARIATITRQLALVDEATRVVSESVAEFPDEDDIADCRDELTRAEKAIEQGVLIRAAKADALKAQGHRNAAKLARETALKYRDAGKATDTILSDAINCKYLRCESDGKATRLFADTPERGKTLYHDLSDGQKYKIAIDIGADQVGTDGLLTVDQIGWEGIDADNRIAIDAHAKERKVHIWVLEASREVGAPRQIVAKQFDPASLAHAPVTEQPAQSVKPEPPAKPKTTPKAKAAKPTQPPVASNDDEDIPF